MKRLFTIAIALVVLLTGSWAEGQRASGTEARGPRSATRGPRRPLHLHSTTPAPDQMATPAEFSLSQNYPNPVWNETTVSCDLPEAADVRLTIRDRVGREVRTLVDGRRDSGTYELTWSGEDSYGQRVAAGTYYCVLVAGGLSDVISMTLAR